MEEFASGIRKKGCCSGPGYSSEDGTRNLIYPSGFPPIIRKENYGKQKWNYRCNFGLAAYHARLDWSTPVR